MIKIRNDAIHKGIVPSKYYCEKAFYISLQKIKDYSKEILDDYGINID